MSNSDHYFMSRALQLARLGLGLVRPNPMVGCVIVNEGLIIGEGYHHRFGGPHAEVVAVSKVKNKELLAAATVYVTLEPCSHYGKTPPCADLLISHHVKRVVIASTDPNPLVRGKGIQKLRDAGIAVESGILKEESDQLNRRFFTFHTKKRPYIILKWAQTADGFVARDNFDSKWISGPESRQLVHRWRSEEAAIAVGKNTVLYDNPRLTVRDWSGQNPLRVVIDPTAQLKTTHQVFDGAVETLYFSSRKEINDRFESIQLQEGSIPQQLLDELYTRGIQSLFIEGGAATLRHFIAEGLWDEARVFVSTEKFESGILAPTIDKSKWVKTRNSGKDKLTIYENT